MRQDLPSLTGLRWFAALLVFGIHFTGMALTTPPGSTGLSGFDQAVHDLGRTGFIGVSFFFVLSGFVLTWSTPGDQASREFWRRRFAKIYPVFAVTALVAVVLQLVVTGVRPGWDVVLGHVLLLQAWTPDQAFVFGLNPVMWSLSCEAFFYLVFPALLLVLDRLSARGLRVAGALFVVATFAVPVLVGEVFTLREPAPPVLVPLDGFEDQFTYWFTYVFPLMRVTEFALGIVVALLVRRGAWVGPPLPVAIGLCVAAFFVNRELPPLWQRSAGMLIPFALLIAAAAQADSRRAWSPLRGGPLVFLGKVSFAFYAVHVLIIMHTMGGRVQTWLADLGVISQPVLPVWGALVVLVVQLAVTVFVAWLVYRFVEVPMTRLLRGARRGVPVV